MTARQIVPESRMRPFYVAVALLLVIVAVMLAAGCALTKTGNQTITQTLEAPSIPGSLTTLSSSLPQNQEIFINPIGSHIVGEIFEINGSTNFKVHGPLRYSIDRGPIAYAMPGNRPTQYDNGVKNITSGEILNATDGYYGQDWSFLMNTSRSEFSYGLVFILNVSTNNDSISNSTSFTISKTLRTSPAG